MELFTISCDTNTMLNIHTGQHMLHEMFKTHKDDQRVISDFMDIKQCMIYLKFVTLDLGKGEYRPCKVKGSSCNKDTGGR